MDHRNAGSRDAVHVACLGRAGRRARPTGRPARRDACVPRGRATCAARGAGRDRITPRAGSTRKWATPAPPAATLAVRAAVFAPYRDLRDHRDHRGHQPLHRLRPGRHAEQLDNLLALDKHARPGRRVLAPLHGHAGPRRPAPPAVQHVRAVHRRAARRGAVRALPLPHLLPAGCRGRLNRQLPGLRDHVGRRERRDLRLVRAALRVDLGLQAAWLEAGAER